MKHTIRYKSSRREIWRWYWKAWRKTLWKTHVFLALIISSIIVITKYGRGYEALVLWTLAAFFVLMIFFAALPQIMFKKSERTLTVDSHGWSSQIGNQFGSRSWDEVASIQEDGEYIVITGKNGNALVVPERAFVSSPTKTEFLNDIQQWKSTYNSSASG